MNDSLALAFYVRHPEAVDALLECDTGSRSSFEKSARRAHLPIELINVTIENWHTWIALESCIERDRRTFECQLLEALSYRLAEVAEVNMKSPRWGGKLTLKLQDGRKARSFAPAMVGWELGTYGQEVFLKPWVWARGGRATERTVADWIATWSRGGLHPSVAADLDNWDAGSVMIDAISVSGYLSTSNESLDVARLADDVIRRFDWVTKNRMEKILTLCRSRRS